MKLRGQGRRAEVTGLRAQDQAKHPAWESFKRANFGSKRARRIGVMGGEWVPSTSRHPAPTRKERHRAFENGKKKTHLNSVIAQTLERSPRNSKVEKIVSEGVEKAERL